jgi:hypothetical protein
MICIAICIAVLFLSSQRMYALMRQQDQAEKRMAELESELNRLLNRSMALLACVALLGLIKIWIA